MTSSAESPALRRLVEQLAARKTWEAANNQPVCACHTQGLADAWTEAKALDASADRERELELARQKFAADAVFQLHKLGAPKRAVEALRALNPARAPIVAVRRFLDRPEAFLVLLGGQGTGKTVAAAYAVRAWLLKAVARTVATSAAPRDVAMWVAAGEIASLSDFGEKDRTWVERMGACELLVLDDLGTETLHPNALARLERMLDLRYGNARPTIITSNTDASTFKARVGARITDRIREAGTVAMCGNESMRRKFNPGEEP